MPIPSSRAAVAKSYATIEALACWTTELRLVATTSRAFF